MVQVPILRFDEVCSKGMAGRRAACFTKRMICREAGAWRTVITQVLECRILPVLTRCLYWYEHDFPDVVAWLEGASGSRGPVQTTGCRCNSTCACAACRMPRNSRCGLRVARCRICPQLPACLLLYANECRHIPPTPPQPSEPVTWTSSTLSIPSSGN
jgi:hypothetical protein